MASICRHLPAPLLQPGELGVHPLQAAGNLGGGAGVAAHLQILLHAHLEEHGPALGDLGQALGDELVGGDTADVLPLEGDGPGVAVEQAGDGFEDGGFPGAVCADEGDDLPLLHGEGDVLDGVDGAVIHIDVLYVQHGHGVIHSFRCPGRP